MTRRRNLERRRHSLAEIRDIMNSMKTLAYMETRKLARFLDTQHAAVLSIEDVAADLLSYFPASLPEAKDMLPVYLVIGTQRGFCGDYNHTLLKYLESSLRDKQSVSPLLIAVGRKLYTLLEGDTRVAARIEGASVVEEGTAVLGRVVAELTSLQEQNHMLNVYGLYHDREDGIVMKKLLPPFQQYPYQEPQFPYPPVLNQTPAEFLAELTDHYLFAILHEMLYSSLLAENHQRMTHLEGAVKHLDDKSAELLQQCNVLRQGEIIEEIEVILLSATSFGEDGCRTRSQRQPEPESGGQRFN